MKNNLNKTLMIAAFFAAALLSGCKSREELPKPKEYTQVPLYMAGQEIPADDQEKYLTNAGVKMYSVGRIVDPGSGTMREAGTVYRIEQAPAWNLIPQYDANPESFARKRLQEQYADSLIGQMNRSLSETREVKHGLDHVRQTVSGVDRKYDALDKENAALKEEIRRQHENMKGLLNSMKKMQKYIEILEEKINDGNTRNFGGRK